MKARWPVALGLLALATPSSCRHARGRSKPKFLSALGLGRWQEDRSVQLRDSAALFHRRTFSAGHGVDFASFVEDELGGNGSDRRVIWVTGYPRSGSSTLLSMVSVTAANSTKGESFALFEPCHHGDKVDKAIKSQGCEGLLRELAECKFEHVKDLWGWSDPHSSGSSTPYTPASAAAMCSEATRITFKTVDYGHNLSNWLNFVDEQPDLHIVAAVRDPRGIWASWKVLEPFATLVNEGKFYTLEDVCRSFAGNIEVQHPRISQVLFEKMVNHPEEVTGHVYASVGLNFGDAQRDWIKANFNNKDCPPPPEWQVGFDDCREDSASVAEQWRDVLDEDDLRRFNENPDCQAVKFHYQLSD